MFLSPIDKIGYFSYMEVPTAYSDALSYLEDISRLYKKLNEIIASYNVLIEYYNGLDDTIAELNKKIAEWEAKLQAMEAWQKELEAQFAAEIAKLNGQFADLSTELNQNLQNAIEEMNRNIQNILNAQMQIINAQLAAFDKKIAENDAATRDWVQAKLDAFELLIPELQKVSVIDPTTGYLVDLQAMIDKLYQLTLWDALTAAEYDSLGLTAEEYDNWYDVGYSTGKGVTAERYDQHGRTIFLKRIREKHSSSVTGKRVKPILLIRDNTDMMRAPGALTAGEYDDLKLTAGAYDALKLTAYQYDWEANRYLKEVTE